MQGSISPSLKIGCQRTSKTLILKSKYKNLNLELLNAVCLVIKGKNKGDVVGEMFRISAFLRMLEVGIH